VISPGGTDSPAATAPRTRPAQLDALQVDITKQRQDTGPGVISINDTRDEHISELDALNEGESLAPTTARDHRRCSA
jgi:hypothetical protein